MQRQTPLDERALRAGELGSEDTLASLMGPVLIIDCHFERSRVVARAVRSICHEILLLDTCGDAREWLGCARAHCIVICPSDGDRSHIELIEYIGCLGYKLPVVIIGERDKSLRSEMRSIAAGLGMTLYTFPYPVELSVLRVLLADQRSRTAGLPAAHTWGGVNVDTVVARHREISGKAPDRRSRAI